ncbi:phosphoribosylglycinamide formyltransferase [Bartonella sp. LJL80]
MKKRIVIFISGSGSNMIALAEAARQKDYPAEIAAVISDRNDAGGIEKAKALGIATHCIERKSYPTKSAFEQAVLDTLELYNPDIICLAGYMRLISNFIIAPYSGRILNIHPSLLPLFKGLDTHQKAIDAGVKVSGCTVHLVTEGMDEGPILGQACVPVLTGDTAKSLAQRVLKVEHQLYPAILRAFIEGKHNCVDAEQQLFAF